MIVHSDIDRFRKRAHKCDLRYFEHHAFHEGSLFMRRWWRCEECGDVQGPDMLLVVRKEQFEEANRNRLTFSHDGSATIEVWGSESMSRQKLSPDTPATVETLQRKIRKLESQLRIFRKANRGKCIPSKGQTGEHATRMALVQSVMAAGMAGRTPQRIAADEGVSTTVIYNILAQYGGAIALRKRKA